MGFLKPRRGTIGLFGEEVAGLAPETIARKGICLVPQGRRVFRSLTVRENLDVARQSRAQGTREGTRPWTLDRVFELFPRLKERHAQLAGSLSGGEQQMLAIGRALMGNPRVLLMDEPSEGLAPQIVQEVGRTIAQLKAEGLSIVLVEQNIKLTLELADDVVIVNTGAVVFSGTAAETRADEKRIAQHLGVF
jgi:branched-chain amino acid transport system ATP-binding protein